MNNKSTERRTKRVDDAFILLRHAVHATDPLAAIAQRADTLDEVRALESRDEKIPWIRVSTQDTHTRALNSREKKRTYGV